MALLNYFLGILTLKFEEISTFLMIKDNLSAVVTVDQGKRSYKNKDFSMPPSTNFIHMPVNCLKGKKLDQRNG